MFGSLLSLALLAGPVETPQAVKPVYQSHDALDEVNAQRKAKGLKPLIRDEQLTKGALNVARFRAERGIIFHTVDDFRGLPPGTTARAAGCAAWHPSSGWGSCCWDGDYTHAGAAWCIGARGLRFMHIFVAGGGNGGGGSFHATYRRRGFFRRR